MLSFKSFLLVLGFLLLTAQVAQAQNYTDTTSTNFVTTTATSNVPTASGVTAQGNYTQAQAQILGMFFTALYGMSNPEALGEYTGSSSPFAEYAPFITMIEGFRSGTQDKVMEGIMALSFPSHNNSNE